MKEALTVTLTAAQAKELHKLEPKFRDTILHGFTDEDLGLDSRPKSWKDLGTIEGYYIQDNAEIKHPRICNITSNENKNIFANEMYAKSSRAYSQLSQLVENMNNRRDKTKGKVMIEFDYEDNLLYWQSCTCGKSSPLVFKTISDAQFSIKYHAELWKQFLIIN